MHMLTYVKPNLVRMVMMTFLQNSGILFPKLERGKKREGKRQIAKQFFMLSSKQSKSLLFSKEFCHLD